MLYEEGMMDRVKILGIALTTVVFCFVNTVACADGEWATSGDNNIYNTNSENVGIGTTDPQAKLDVNAGINEDWAAYIHNGGGHGYGLRIRSGSSSDVPTLQVEDNYNNVKFIVKSNGKVGIGTASPASMLHVQGGTYFKDNEASISSELDSKTGHRMRLYLNDEQTYGYVRGLEVITELSSGRQVGDTSNKKYIEGLIGIQNVRGGELYGNSYGVFGLSYVRNSGIIHGHSISVYGQGAIATDGHVTGDLIGVYGNVYASGGQVDGKRWAGYFNGNTYIDGNLGIGESDPQSKLAVNGTITAKEVKVTTDGWSDFVFEDSYKLPSLDHVENYIKENKHLPDVPSAEQIAQDGLSMSGMMAKQMQKIEELTLYMIELKKQNERLAEASEKLKKENESLKERMAAIEEEKE